MGEMTMKNGDMPAMPVPDTSYGEDMVPANDMTKREMMAMAAMQGILSSLTIEEDMSPRDLARCSVADADALLAELERTK